MPIERFVWSVPTNWSPLVPTNLHSKARLENKPPCLSRFAKVHLSSWNIVVTYNCWELRLYLGCMPINMSGFGGEICGKRKNVHWRDEIFKASVYSIFILTESSFGRLNKNRNRFISIDMATIFSEALRN